MNNFLPVKNLFNNSLKILFVIPLLTLGIILNAQNTQCLSFDQGDYIEVPNTGINFMGFNDFTFEAEIYGQDNIWVSNHIIFSNRLTASSGMMFFIHHPWGSSPHNLLSVQIQGVNHFIVNNGTFNADLLDGNCHHVAISKNASILSFYIDGSLIGIKTINTNSTFGGSSTLQIANDYSNGNEFDGNISDVRIWDDARTSAEIDLFKDSTVLGTSANLVHNWELNDGFGQIALDKTLNSNGILGGDTLVQFSDPSWSNNCCSSILANITYNQGNFVSCNSTEYFMAAQAVGGIAPYSYVWLYNGMTYTGQTPIIEIFDYNPNVSLTITDSTGVSVNENVVINVSPYLLDFTQSIISQTCDSTVVQYDAITSFPTTVLNWNIGGQFFYGPTSTVAFANDGSTVNASLTSQSWICPDTAFHSLVLDTNTCGPSPTGCVHILTLNDSYGDGWNGNSLNMYVNGVFSNNYTFTSGYTQSFNVSLNAGDQVSFIWDGSGFYNYECSWNFTSPSGSTVFNELSQLDTLMVGPYITNCSSLASNITFSQGNQISCISTQYFMAAQAMGGISPYSYLWTYGGMTYTGPTPMIEIFAYDPLVSLTVVDAAGETINDVVTINVDTFIVDIGYTILSQTCDSTVIQYNAISNLMTTFWQWNIGPYFANIPNPIFAFANDGSTINATLSSPNWFCPDTAFNSLVLDTNICNSNIVSNVNFTQGNQMSCNSYEFFFNSNVTGGTAPYSLVWSYNGITYTGAFPVIEIYDYDPLVFLSLTDASGQTITETFVVNVNQNFTIISSSVISQTCDSTTIQFYGSSTNLTTLWQWNVAGQTSNMQDPIFTFENTGTAYIAELNVFGLCNDSAIHTFYVDSNSCPPVSSGCGHILTLEDSYGDGWNGNSLNAYVNGVLYDNYTFTFGSAQTFPISLNTGDQISFVWDNSGNWTYECSWSFTNASGNLVLNETSPLSTSNVGPYTAFCDDFNTIITSTLDTMFSCDSSLYQFIASPNGGTAPYTYVWTYDGATYTDEFPLISTNSANPTISVIVTDANGLTSNETFLVTIVEPLTINVNSNTPTCDSSNYLYAYAYPSGGSGDYSYLWSNGVTDYSISSFTDGITLGSYNVIVTDNITGCTISATVDLYDACYSINGTVYVDYNGNCIVDGADHPLSNSYFVDLTGSGVTWGDWDYVSASDNGHYFIEDVSVGIYGLDVNGNNVNSYTQNCPNASFTVTVDAANPNPTVDIFMTPPAPSQDLSVSLYSTTTFTPGFPYWAYASYCNDGTIPMSGSVVLSYDTDLTYIVGTSNPDVVDAVNNILTWNFTNLQPGQCVSLFPDFTTSTSAVLGSMMSNNIVINPIAGDVTPANNTAYVTDSVVGSWDPNDKSVSPAGDISPDVKDHSYHINFQNEGNGPATLVVVRDDLDDNLDIQTLRNVSASHNFVLTIENIDELVFTFNNIYLTPKDIDEPNSKGHIDFTISQQDNLPLGTVIENTAEIYFDFNEAIITNTAINTIVKKSTGIETVKNLEAIDVYPNPSNGLFNVSIEDDNSIQMIEVYDVLGKLIFSANDLSGTKAIVNLQNTSSGIYMMKVTTEKGTASERLVVNK